MSDSFNFGASNGGGGGYDPNDFRASYPLPLPVTATRPLPPLPAHLQSHSRPPSPAEPVASTSASSTPNAAPSPVAGAAGEETPTSGKKRERGRQLGKESGGNSRKSSPAGLGGLLPVLEGVADDLAGKPTAVKRVKVGARASIACGTCRKRKVRCSGEWPICIFCATRNLPCVYEGHPAENGGSASGSPAPFGLAHFLPMASLEPILPPVNVMLEALDHFFLHNYDTFYFLHRPTLSEAIKDGTAPKELVCCILAFAGRFCQSLQDLHPTSPSAASEHYSALAAQVLANPPYQSSQPSTSATPIPTDSEISLVRCQCYLLLGLYECTEGVENRGWMKIGTAIRMAQLLRLGFEDDDEGSISRSRADPLQSEIRRRTFWSCFLLDRTITDGRERPCTLKAPLPSVLRMPGADADFQLGRKGQLGARFDPNPPRWNLSSKMEAAAPLEHEADLYGQTLRVAEIWQRVATYIASGGRNFDRRAPWIPESTFATLQQDLGTFSSLLPEFYQFSEANLVAHCMIGQGRLFGMMHLLFACATLNLHRDYLPFLPTMDFKASNGPIDGEPLYGQPLAPVNWWQHSLAVAFEAAGTISDLCTHLTQHGSQITHPFAGYAALAAGTLHCHLKFWPHSAPHILNASVYLEQDVGILTSLKEIHPIASSWCEGIAKLHLLYFNLVRGVIDVDPNKIRASVIKLLRTARDEEGSTSPARMTNGFGGITSLTQGAFDSQFLATLQDPATFQADIGVESDYPHGMASEAWWGHWGEFSLLGFEGERTSAWAI